MSGAGETIRAFFAVELGDAARAAAGAAIRALRLAPRGGDVRWVRPESLHVTLRFLGDTRSEQVPALAAAARAALAGATPFELALGAVRLFPTPRRPRVVTLDVAPEEPLAALAAALEDAVVAEGFAPEERSFRAHLTLGRVRGRDFPSPDATPAPPPSPFAVEQVVLFRSELGSGPAQYTPLEHVALGGS